MRKYINKLIVLCLCIFLLSCYTYKNIELNTVKEKDKLKIHLKTAKVLKGRVLKVNEENIFIKKRTTSYKIQKSTILGIHKREPSKSKNTALGILISIPIVYLIYELVTSGIKISGPNIGNPLKDIK